MKNKHQCCSIKINLFKNMTTTKKLESMEEVCNILKSIHDPETKYLETQVLDIFNSGCVDNYLETNDPKLMTWISSYYYYIGDIENMKNFLLKAINFGDQNAMLNLGACYFEEGDIKKAYDIWLQCSKLGNNVANTRVDILNKLNIENKFL